MSVAIESAQALTFSEPPDAGPNLNAAADTTTVGNVGNEPNTHLTRITGFLAGSADLFKISVAAGTFTASTLLEDVDPSGSIGDTQLFLFNALGQGIVANDDAGSGVRSRISQFLTAGVYYLGISKFNLDPVDSNGDLIFPNTFNGQVNAINPNPLRRFSGVVESSSRSYTIAVNSTPIPTPALLPGLVGLGLGALRKRKTASKLAE